MHPLKGPRFKQNHLSIAKLNLQTYRSNTGWQRGTTFHGRGVAT